MEDLIKARRSYGGALAAWLRADDAAGGSPGREMDAVAARRGEALCTATVTIVTG